LFKETINISKEDVEDYHCAVFTHAIKFFQECTSLKKPIVEHFFISLLHDLSMEDFVSLGNLLSPNKQLYATLNMRAWVPQDLKKKVLKQTMNHRMISLALKPQDVYDVKKKDVPTI
jgi:hypothetical protein